MGEFPSSLLFDLRLAAPRVLSSHSLYSVAASSQFQNPISSLDSQCRRKTTTTKAGRHSTRNNHTVLQAKAATALLKATLSKAILSKAMALPKACSTACSLHHSKRKRRTEDASCRVWQ